MVKERVLIVCAHSDDEAAGMGGTIAKFRALGHRMFKIVFSYGEQATPHLKEAVMTKARVEESHEISDLMGFEKTVFFGLPDMKVKDNVEKYDIKKKLKKMIRKFRPTRIYFPTLDAHLDHRAVNETVNSILDEMKFKGAALEFEVWELSKSDRPVIYEDISEYYKDKIEMMKAFKSQKHYMYPLMVPVRVKAMIYGKKNHCKYAERFYKVR